jgi:hypothetical protein
MQRMQRSIVITSLAGSLAIYLQTINFFESFAMLLLFGIVPWRNDPLNPRLMLVFYLLSAIVLLAISLRKKLNRYLLNTTQSQVRA